MGNYKSAYLTKQPNAVDPSEWIARQEEIGLYHSQLRREREQQKQAQKQKQFEGDFSGEYDLSSSGNGTIDSMLMQIGLQSLAELSEAKEAGERAMQTEGPNSKAYIEAKQRYDNIMNRPDLLKLATNDINQNLAKRQEQLATGNFIQDPDDLKSLDGFIKNPIKWKNMPDGTMLINSGDTTSTLKDFTNALKLNPLIAKVDENAIIQDVATKFKDKIIEDRKGYTTTKRTNTWESYRDPETKEMVGGVKAALTKQYENVVTDDFAKSVLASRGQFGYDSMDDAVKDQLKANIITDMVENSRPYIKEAIEKDFDTSARNQDERTANSNTTKGITTKDGKGKISFVEDIAAPNGKTVIKRWAFDDTDNSGGYRVSGANKSNQAMTLNEIRINTQTGEINLLGRAYKGAVKNNTKDSDNKYSKEVTTNDTPEKSDQWEDISITNKTEITGILGPIMGLNSYDKIVAQLKGETSKAQDTSDDLPELDELPDLP